MIKFFEMIKLTPQSKFILLVTAFIMAVGNLSLFGRILAIYPPSFRNLPFLLSLALFFSTLTALYFLAICHGRATRWVLALFLIITAQTAYYMDTFGIIVDMVMIDNSVQAETKELTSLVNASMLLRTLFLGIIPAWLVIKFCPKAINFGAEMKSKLRLMGFSVLLIVLMIVPFIAGYTSFIREHKITRFYANPTYSAYSIIKYITQQINVAKKVPLKQIAQDAVKIDSSEKRNELMIMVVGETARFDRFSINGYHRETNPMLAKQDVISLSNVSSCGTSTSVSVPCMFSSLGRKNYDKQTALNQENALDVLTKNGVEVLWRDNNSDSKGVATRLTYEDFKSLTLNTMCEGECRDVGMLVGLDKYIADRKGKDILIVLHQMGNHGPEYYRRYPKEFEKFKPMCMTGELRDCNQTEIDNSYDNAILYTDYFLSNVIDLLKKYDDTHATAMLYVADHGESLGEHGLYLHAMPYLVAPKEQTHVPAIVWMGKHFDYKLAQLLPYKDAALSHDDVFCSLLVAYELDASKCSAKKEMLMQNQTLTNNANPAK
jgi:lipid A ethanolaminephosphotransferase